MAVAEQVAFDLAAVVRKYVEPEDEPDPVEIATRVARDLDDHHLRETVEHLLPHFVRKQIRELRSCEQGRRREGRSRWEAHPDPRWREKLDGHIATASGYKRLRLCTAADLTYAVDQYRKAAATYERKARAGAWLVDALATHGVETVGDLPEAVLEELVPDVLPDR